MRHQDEDDADDLNEFDDPDPSDMDDDDDSYEVESDNAPARKPIWMIVIILALVAAFAGVLGVLLRGL